MGQDDMIGQPTAGEIQDYVLEMIESLADLSEQGGNPTLATIVSTGQWCFRLPDTSNSALRRHAKALAKCRGSSKTSRFSMPWCRR